MSSQSWYRSARFENEIQNENYKKVRLFLKNLRNKNQSNLNHTNRIIVSSARFDSSIETCLGNISGFIEFIINLFYLVNMFRGKGSHLCYCMDGSGVNHQSGRIVSRFASGSE